MSDHGFCEYFAGFGFLTFAVPVSFYATERPITYPCGLGINCFAAALQSMAKRYGSCRSAVPKQKQNCNLLFCPWPFYHWSFFPAHSAFHRSSLCLLSHPHLEQTARPFGGRRSQVWPSVFVSASNAGLTVLPSMARRSLRSIR